MGSLDDLIKENEGKKGRIMVIDKLPETTTAIKNIFPDYEVFGYTNIDESLKELGEKPEFYDLILLDVDVRTSIYEAEDMYNKLRAYNKNVPIIFHTGMDKSFKMSYKYLEDVAGYCIQKGDMEIKNIVEELIKKYKEKCKDGK